MKDYNGWSGEFRSASLRLTNAAKKEGWIQDPKKCNRCGQEEGILHLHNEDYDVTYYTLEKVFDRSPINITKMVPEHFIFSAYAIPAATGNMFP